MTNLNSRGRQRSPWPWIMGLIILAGFFWFLLNYVYMPDYTKKVTSSSNDVFSKRRYIDPIDSINEVKEFIDFSRSTSNPGDTRHYSEKGLIKLQSALSYLADRINPTDAMVKKNIDTLDITVAKIDTSSSNYLSELMPAFSAAVTTMFTIQKLNYPDLAGNISDLKNTENTINESKPIRSQCNKIVHFFNEAGNTISQMKVSYAINKSKVGY